MKSFTFIVLSYNHSGFIVEHLESIKYQIDEYGSNFEVDIIVSDDFSKDDTSILIRKWFRKNSYIFRNCITLFNEKNLGTCKSLKNALEKCDSEFCKITAGDDIYSSENIFDFALENKNALICTGLPIRLIDGKLRATFFETINYIASKYIYRSSSFNERLIGLSVINAPNIIYSMEALKNDKVLNVLDDYDVVEDFPLQVAISEIYPEVKFEQSYKNIVYYRRTEGSTYLVANERFKKDQIKVLNYLIADSKKKKKFMKRVLLKNRLFVFNNPNFVSRNILNLSKIVYFYRLLFFFVRVFQDFISIQPNLVKGEKHYKLIKEAAKTIND